MTEMTQSAKEAMNAYQKAWRQSHKAKIAEYNVRYWNKRANMMQDEQEPEQEQTVPK